MQPLFNGASTMLNNVFKHFKRNKSYTKFANSSFCLPLFSHFQISLLSVFNNIFWSSFTLALKIQSFKKENVLATHKRLYVYHTLMASN